MFEQSTFRRQPLDRAIKKKKFPPKRIALIIVVCAVVLFLSYQVMSRSGETRLKVDPSRMTVSETEYGEFLEYYPFDGTVVPVTSVYLDVETGGRVEEIFAEDGKYIHKGDPILRFSNDTVRRQSIDSENQLLKNLDELRNTQLNIAQNELNRKEQLLNINYEITKMEKKYNRYKKLMSEDLAISKEAFETLEDELNYMIAKRDLLEERIQKENILNEKQLEQANTSIESLTRSLELLRKSVESLMVTAPISGHLSSIEADIGQSIPAGKRIGQIDILDNLKLKVGIDQYYNAKVTVGTMGKFTLDGTTYGVEVTKIYPEVLNSEFKVDMAFVGEPPQGIKRGQTLTVELSFSEPEKSLMVKKGGFYQGTGGRWAYLISEDGSSAQRATIRLGRQNPRYVEILEGLNEGDWIITSGYETFNEADLLIFHEPLTLEKNNLSADYAD
jgi:HlyD family secretion protein